MLPITFMDGNTKTLLADKGVAAGDELWVEIEGACLPGSDGFETPRAAVEKERTDLIA